MVMKFASVLAALAVAAALPGPVAMARTAPPTIAELTAEGRIHGVEVSPSGRYLALIRHNGAKDAIQIIDLTARTQTSILPPEDAGALNIDLVHWKTDERLIYNYRSLMFGGREGKQLVGFSGGLVAMDRSGANQTWMPSFGVLDWLDQDPGHIVVRGYDTSEGRAIRALKVYVATGETTTLDVGAGVTVTWDVDRNGAVVLRYDALGQRSGFRVMGRGAGGQWQELFRIREKDVRAMPEFQVVGTATDATKLYVAIKPKEGEAGDTRELRLYDLTTRTMGPMIWSIPGYDFTSVEIDRKTGEPLSLCYWADAQRCEIREPELRGVYETLLARFGPERSVSIHAMSADAQVLVLYVEGPVDPGSFHVYDRRTGKLELLGAQRPALKPERLAPTARFDWKSRDGFALSGYLTPPQASAAGKPPLILMPHGGPEARDNLQFQSWAQAFAARGYMVFQPNFRGSGGFGTKFAALGYGQWGLRMQDDVMDGVQALIDSGKVDPDRICVVGASYGGYVSLYAGAKAPERFKCVVSFAGVSDLVASQKWERTRRGVDSPVYQYWLRSIGDPEKEREKLVATSPITYAGGYGPPVLLIHGTEDDIVPIAQSRAMEKALKRAGRSVRLIELEDEGHGGWDSETEASFLAEMIAFVEAAIGRR